VNITLFSKNIELALDWLLQNDQELSSLFRCWPDQGKGLHQFTPNVEEQLLEAQRNMVLLVNDRIKELTTAAKSLGMNSTSARLRLQLWRALQSERGNCEICKTDSGLELLGFGSEQHDIKLDHSFLTLADRICKKHRYSESVYGCIVELFRGAEDTRISNRLRDLGILDWLPPMGRTPPFYLPNTLMEPGRADIFDVCEELRDLSSRRDILQRTHLHQLLDSYEPCYELSLGWIMHDLSAEPFAYDKQDCLGRTPLYIACQKGSPSVVRHLLQEGANPTIASYRKVLPIHVAAAKGSTEICQMLRNHPDVRIDASGPNGRLARDYAIEGHYFSAANILSFNYNSKQRVHQTDLNDTMLRGFLLGSSYQVQIALESDADPDALFDPTFSGGRQTETALTLALRQHHKEKFKIAERLLRAGADLETETERGETALHVCVRRCDEAGVNWLLEHGADVMARDAKGRTALMIVAKKGIASLVILLLNFANERSKHLDLVHAIDGKGHTALGYARWNRNGECEALLEQQDYTILHQT
jgi:ankyrin repeat protein